jgi:hypothetical protein
MLALWPNLVFYGKATESILLVGNSFARSVSLPFVPCGSPHLFQDDPDSWEPIFPYYNRIPRMELFIQKRSLFSLMFWRLSPSSMTTALVSVPCLCHITSGGIVAEAH